MHPEQAAHLMRTSIAIAVGTLVFLFFMMFCYTRAFGPGGIRPEDPSAAFPAFLIGLGICIALVGVIEAGGHPPGERGFGSALAAEGILLVVLTMIAWTSIHPAPPLNPLPF